MQAGAVAAQAYPPIKLKKSNLRLDRLAGKVVTGVGSAAKSARRMVSRIGSAADGAAQLQVGVPLSVKA